MRTFDELESAWQSLAPLPRGRGTVRLIVVRPAPGERRTPDRAELSFERGLHGDRWLRDDGDPLAQITLMTARVAELVGDGEQPLERAGDNFIVDLDLSEEALPVGARLRLGTALLEVTPELHLGCKQFRGHFGPGALKWVNWKAFRARRLRGVNCRVIEDGAVSVGDPIEVVGKGGS